MPGLPQARMTDLHICPMCAPPIPPAPLPIILLCDITVLVCKLAAARMGDLCASVTPPAPHPIAKGSMTVMIGKKPAARMLDPCAGGGIILPPCAITVLTGG
ncbi:PAAR domain-containing protein [Pseudorhodobacter sp.]|uniref:PAAR domain-containing protein n=1 Tax=Pseudorhodobacter sp. TaxID=1934400 RepID=UPI002649F593|nr:PAAR domain-containing protein [Pseudorhodobacter sp.]MDN5787845.1 PAAR domain-containing protein [Pseudorhodobacter sp.]